MIVYLVKNKINGKRYVGMTTRSVEERWKEHVQDRNSKAQRNKALSRAIRKYGETSFEISVIGVCRTGRKQDLSWLETFCIATAGTKGASGYNMTDGGEGTRGKKVSEKTKAKIRAARSKQVIVGTPCSEERAERIGNANRGKKRSAKVRKSKSRAMLGKPQPWNKGKKRSKESCERMRKSRYNYLGKEIPEIVEVVRAEKTPVVESVEL